MNINATSLNTFWPRSCRGNEADSGKPSGTASLPRQLPAASAATRKLVSSRSRSPFMGLVFYGISLQEIQQNGGHDFHARYQAILIDIKFGGMSLGGDALALVTGAE